MFIRLLILLTCFSLLFSCKHEDAIDNENESNSFVPSGYIKIWEDHFDSTQINTDNWVVGSLIDPISNDTIPGARGAYLLNYKYAGYISENNCYIEDGALVLSNKEEQISGNNPWGQFEFTSGWVHSMHRVFFNKGYVEIKAKFPSGDKVWPALWLISEDLVWGPEWDMWEYFGEKNNVGTDIMGLHLAYDEWPNVQWSSYWLYDFDLLYDCEQWHIYGFEWTEEKAVWTIDGETVRILYSNAISSWPNEDMYFVLNNGLRNISPNNNTAYPNFLRIDYIELYQKN